MARAISGQALARLSWALWAVPAHCAKPDSSGRENKSQSYCCGALEKALCERHTWLVVWPAVCYESANPSSVLGKARTSLCVRWGGRCRAPSSPRWEGASGAIPAFLGYKEQQINQVKDKTSLEGENFKRGQQARTSSLGESLAQAGLRAVPWLHLRRNLLVHSEREAGANRKD